MPRTRVSERARWEQLVNAVIELGQNVKILEERVKALEPVIVIPIDSKYDEDWLKTHVQS